MADKLPPDIASSPLARQLQEREAHERLDALLRAIGPLPPLLRPVRVAMLLDVARQRVYELIANGTLEHVKLGGRSVRVTREGLVKFLARGCGCPAARWEDGGRR